MKAVIAYTRYLLESNNERSRSEVLFEAFDWVDDWRDAHPEETKRYSLRLEVLQEQRFDVPPFKFGLEDYLHNEDPPRNAFGRAVVY
jgi:hypothetical protein